METLVLLRTLARVFMRSSATTTTTVRERGGTEGFTWCVDNYLDNDVKFEKLKQLTHNGYSCTLGPERKPCSQQLAVEAALLNLSNFLELSHDELDLVFLTSIQTFTLFFL